MPSLTYLSANWLLVIIVILAVAIVGVCAFFLKNWKLAVATVVLIVFGLLYQNAVTSGIKIQMTKDAEEKTKLLTDRLDAANKTNDTYAAQAAKDAQTISDLEAKANEIPENDSPCLDSDSVGRLRSIR